MVKAMVKRSVDIRELKKTDLRAVMEIDEMVRGCSRPEYWDRRFIGAESVPPWASLIAEMDNKVVGFLLGWSSLWDFGVADEVGWIDVIGVHPAYRLRGIGRALVSEFNRLAKERRRIDKVFTLVDPEQEETASFFSQIGFAHGKLIQMEKGSGSGPSRDKGGGPNGTRTRVTDVRGRCPNR